MSVPISEPPALTLAGDPAVADGKAPGQWAAGRVYLWLTLGALVIAALSLLFPSTPSYDPWAWIFWGRQIVHGTLNLHGGPSWKPLPVMFTTVFAPLGSIAPNLWLLVARAGAALGALMTFKLAARITWWLREDRSGGKTDRRASLACAALAGVVALVGLVFSGDFLPSSLLGYSEGLMFAALLIAFERHIDGHYRQAFAVGMIVALDRPEFWVIWGPYGLWLMWKDPGSRALVMGLAVLTLAVWFIPQKLGSGSFDSAATRDEVPVPGSAALASCPICTEIADHAWVLVIFRVKVAMLAAFAAAGWCLWRERRPLLRFPLNSDRTRGLNALLLFALFAFLWWLLVGLETEAGFSGGGRYLVPASASLYIVGGAGFGWAALELGRFAGRRLRRPRLRANTSTLTFAGAGLMLLVFLLVPGWLPQSIVKPAAVRRDMRYQARLREDLTALISRAGGAQRLLACGPIMIEGYQEPMVSWYLNVPLTYMEQSPYVDLWGLAPVPKGQWPAVILRDSATAHGAIKPPITAIQWWEYEGARYRVTRTSEMTMYRDCRA